MNVRACWLLPCLAVGLTSCGMTVQSRSTMAPRPSVEGPSTFAWDPEMDRPTGDPRLENNHFFLDRLHEAIEWELALRGFRHDDASPDLLMHHHLSLADHEEVANSSAGDPTARAYVYEEGTIVVHMSDAATGDEVWVAWATANVEPALQSPGSMRRWVEAMVRAMFREWPVPDQAGRE